jgi:hypothetical protein
MSWIGGKDGLKRPGMAVRWGIGIAYSRSGGFDGTPPRIGEEVADGGGGGQGSGPRGNPRQSGSPQSSGSSSGYGGYGSSGPQGQGGVDGKQSVDTYAAELGTRVLESLTTRIERGDYGEFMKSAATQTVEAPKANTGYGSSSSGGYGHQGRGGTQKAEENTFPQIMPGIVFVGEGQEKRLVEKAREQDLDVLLIFQVRASVTRKGVPMNNTKMLLYEVASGKQVFDGTNINNVQVSAQRQKGVAADGIEEATNELFEAADARFSMQEMPDLNPEHALLRVGMLVGDDSSSPVPVTNPLPVLVEIHYYEARKLITTEQLVQAYQRLLGDGPGAKLATGTADQRKDVIDRWLPR